ncbi:serine protease [Aromatoleum evansii]|uniref:Serine protease n=1 Tax=Aromatoleum evansii TaxID=59406 RepID=A0ABZ1AIW1_AROEV|nr:serine protease [Aromatoleum evansii]
MTRVFGPAWPSACAWLSALSATILFPRLAAADLVDVLPRVKPSVVAVGTFQRTRSPQFRFLGTGFAVGSGRMVATNAHVVSVPLADDQLESLVIVVPGAPQGSIRKAAKVAADPNADLALLRLDGEPLPVLPLADGSFVAEGRSIAFTGFPIGSALGFTPVTHRGIVAAVTPIGIPQANSGQLNPALIRRLAGDSFRVYQLDATAYPGNSGSPVFDPDSGEVLGIVNMVFVKGTKENALSAPSGITYAIPVSHLRALLLDVR